MMAFSMAGIDLRLPPIRGALAGFLLNYLFLSGLILLLASMILEEEVLVLGFVVMAAVPPAVAVVPLTKLLDGDVRLALYSEALSYLGSLVLTPLIIFLFAGEAGVEVGETAKIVLLLILLPILASRRVSRLKIDPANPINAGLFTVTYIVVGLNSSSISTEAAGVLLIAFARTFLSGAIVYAGAAFAGVDRPQRIAYTLFASFKNLGLAATVALLLFGPRAGIPAAVCILTETSFYILLSALAGRRKDGSKAPETGA
jgi:BASS family bile acid:Na+ symporter